MSTAPDIVDPLIAQQAVEIQRRTLEHAEWKRRQAIQPSLGTWLTPTLPERIARLNPMERHDLGRLIRSMKLRKIIRRTLAEAFWARETQTIAEAQREGTMARLRAAVRQQESMQAYENALSFEPVYTRSTYGDHNDPPAVTRALERSLIVQQGVSDG